MPIPKYDGSPEEQWISSCMHEIGKEYGQEQALAICYKQMEMSETELAEHQTEPELENLPDVQPSETEDSYLERCIPTLYPEKYDQRIAASYCADHYQKKVTVTELKKAKLSIMKSKPLSDFDRKKMEFMDKLIELKEKGIYIG